MVTKVSTDHMDALTRSLQAIHASLFVAATKVQNYHWNVVGPTFNDTHTFLGSIYDELITAVDDVAERMRTLDLLVPSSLTYYLETSAVSDEKQTESDARVIFTKVTDDYKTIIRLLNDAFYLCDHAGLRGLCNYIEGLIDSMSKTMWKTNASTKG